MFLLLQKVPMVEAAVHVSSIELRNITGTYGLNSLCFEATDQTYSEKK